MLGDLDDRMKIQKIDASDTASQIASFIPNLSEAASSKVSGLKRPSTICMSGMGGSAMAADVLLDYLTPVSNIYAIINRDVILPKWVDRSTLSLITSYSGNTQEALDVLDRSIKTGCNICCITSGGKLLERCEANGVPFVKVPSGIQPRAALGYLLGAASAVLESVGAGTPASDFTNAAKNMIKAIDKIVPSVPKENNRAKQLAEMLYGTVPALYAPKNVRSVAVRWQNQINENSKMVAFSGEIPEMNHNQIVGWLMGEACAPCRPIFLLPDMMDRTIEKMSKVTIEMFTEAGLRPMIVPLSGHTNAENLISGIVLGDYVSYYLAMLKGLDPGPVPVIQEFKTRIA